MWFQFILLIILNLLDAVGTTLYVNRVGTAGEGNPIMRTLIESHGTSSLFIGKLIVLVFWGLILILITRNEYKKKQVTTVLKCLNVFFGLLFVWSLFCFYNA
jgi:hypothetical protein